jgi:hypothetical protein
VKTGATRGQGGDGLHAHWTMPKNERVEAVPPRHLAGRALREQLRELTAATAHARFQKPAWHLWLAPNPADRKPLAAEIDDLWARIEQEFGLEGQAYAAVRHTLRRQGPHHADWTDDVHEHRAYDLADADGHMVDPLKNERIRRQRICAEWEYDHGFALTPPKHMRAILRWLDRRRPEVARALRAAGHDEDAPPRIAEITPDARDRAERAAFKPGDLNAILQACWDGTRTALAFEAALRHFDLRLAMGRVPVVVDGEGVVHPLRRMLAAALRARGKIVREADVAARLQGLPLVSAEEARAALREIRRARHLRDGDAAQAEDHRQDAPRAARGPAEGSEDGRRVPRPPEEHRTGAAHPQAPVRRASGDEQPILERTLPEQRARRADADREDTMPTASLSGVRAGISIMRGNGQGDGSAGPPRPPATSAVAGVGREEATRRARSTQFEAGIDPCDPPAGVESVNAEEWLQTLLGDQAYTPKPPDDEDLA